jgi:hypothetical protein
MEIDPRTCDPLPALILQENAHIIHLGNWQNLNFAP